MCLRLMVIAKLLSFRIGFKTALKNNCSVIQPQCIIADNKWILMILLSCTFSMRSQAKQQHRCGVCMCAHATMCRVTSMIYNHRSDFLTYSDLALLCPLLNGSNLSATGVGGHVTQPGPVIVLNSTGQDYWLKGWTWDPRQMAFFGPSTRA